MFRQNRRSTNSSGPMMIWQGSAWVAIVWMMVVNSAGCSSSDANSNASRDAHDIHRRAGDPSIVPKQAVPDEYRPLDEAALPIAFGEKTYADGSPTHYADDSPAYLPDGSPIDYRPRNIQRQLTALPKSYARDMGQETLATEGPANQLNIVYLRAVPESLVGLAGPVNTPRIDPDSDELAWPVIQCTHAACPGRNGGQALRFIAKWPAIALDETGNIVWHWPQNDKMMSRHCPSCGRTDRLSPYSPTAIRERADQLHNELARIRAALGIRARRG